MQIAPSIEIIEIHEGSCPSVQRFSVYRVSYKKGSEEQLTKIPEYIMQCMYSKAGKISEEIFMIVNFTKR